MSNENRLLITGSNGFIGSKLCSYYVNLGYEVVGIDIEESQNLNKDIEFISINLENEDVSNLYKRINPKAIIHCAGSASVGLSVEHPEFDFNRNVGILYKTLSSIKSAGIYPKFIFLSSAAVYGNPKKLPIDEKAIIKPISPYGLHKKMCEDLCEYFHYNEGFNIAIARIFSAYGEGLNKQILWDIYNKLSHEGDLQLFGTGNETRDFIHIDDIISCIDLIKNTNSNEIFYNIACGEEIKIKDLAEMFVEKLGVNKSIVKFNGFKKEGDPINWRADISRIKKLGFKPEIDIEKGLDKYVQWLGAMKNE